MPLSDATLSVALLGPTNTGKTHRAVERMLEHATGMIGLPLRLLAREVYDRVSARLGEDRVALVTGEEKRVPRRPDYWVCTTEAMPIGRDVDFIAVDEIQLATHDERGHVFTERLLHARGRRESWFLGSSAMRPMVEKLVPAARHEQHPRLSRLTYAGASKLSRLPPRSAIVAFSIPELYRMAAQLRAFRGGAAVVLGALSPRARNAQVAMFQAGEVDYLVATDAIGMGLNLDVTHVAFASLRKFDGRGDRRLTETELSQIAGRAGRYLRDGTFGTVAPLELDSDVALSIEQHRFEPVRRVRYRNAELDYSSPEALLASLERPSPSPYLVPVPSALDHAVLRALLADGSVAPLVRRGPALELLFQVCQVPDFRKILFEVHVELLRELFVRLAERPLDDHDMAVRLAELDDESGDVDTLLARTARLRTWAYVAHRSNWVEHPDSWRERIANLEDRLSDALHRTLVDTFVERKSKTRTSASRQRGAAPVRGALGVPEHPFAALETLRERVAPETPSEAALEALADAPHASFELDAGGRISAGGVPLAVLTRGPSVSLPEVRLHELSLPAGVRSRLQRRLLAFARDSVGRLLEPFAPLRSSERAPLRAIAHQLERGLGSALTSDLGSSLELFDVSDTKQVEALGITLGVLSVFVPSLLSRRALAQRGLLVRVHRPELRLPPLDRPRYPVRDLPAPVWLALGYVTLDDLAVRIDLAERAASALAQGKPEVSALRPLGLPKRDARRIAATLRSKLYRGAPSPETGSG
ncbi:MAG TPA: helicase-related protein [Polyangiaceae bacterium]